MTPNPAWRDRGSAVDFRLFAGRAFADELEQRLEVPGVGASERVKVGLAAFVVAVQVMAARPLARPTVEIPLQILEMPFRPDREFGTGATSGLPLSGT